MNTLDYELLLAQWVAGIVYSELRERLFDVVENCVINIKDT